MARGEDTHIAGASAKPASALIAALMTVMFLAAMEVTIVGTAMPRVVAALGGMRLYPWVFTSFMLASTVSGPFYGKFADLLGVRRCLFVALGLFLLGSGLCGAATTMMQLVFFRALQGLGAGGIMVLVFTAFGHLFPPETRSQSMGVLNIVWGVASLVGPLAGGILVTQFSWPWVFWVNLPVGLLAAALIGMNYPRHEAQTRTHVIDWLGASLLVGGLLPTMLALSEAGNDLLWLLPVGIVLLGAFVWQELRAPEPILPLQLMLNPRFAIPLLLAFGAAVNLTSITTYIPLFIQGVLGRSATESGAVMAPMMVIWPIMGAFAGWAMNRTGFRRLAVTGTLLMLVGYGLLASPLFKDAPWQVGVQGALIGAGMGLTMGITMMAVQVAVSRSQIGVASATVTLARNVGSTLGLSLLGGMQLRSLLANLAGSGLPADRLALVQDLRTVLAQHESGTLAADLWTAFSQAMSGSILTVFGVTAGIALLLFALSWGISPLTPKALAAHAEAARQKTE